MAEQGPKTARLPCGECGGGYRHHDVLQRHGESSNDGYQVDVAYEICKCRGCGTVRFRQQTITEDDYDPMTGEIEEGHVEVYPQRSASDRKPVDADTFPEAVERMYLETVRALNAGCPVLAAGGLRAIVEALCLDQKVPGSDLYKKINNLVTKELLAKPQADLLHEERFLGNTALHELLAPARPDLDTGLDIVETLLAADARRTPHGPVLRLGAPWARMGSPSASGRHRAALQAIPAVSP
jgi:hypothetical protein